MRIYALVLSFILLFSPLANVTGEKSLVEDAEIMAQCLYGECRGMKSKAEQAAVAWVILNRVDSERYPNSIREVITQPNQFTGYLRGNPILPELLELSEDVIYRWEREKAGEEDVGRVLPQDYLYFAGWGGHNHFSQSWPVSKCWDWSYEDPYVEREEKENDGIFSESGYRTFDGMASDPECPSYSYDRSDHNSYPTYH